MNTENKRINFIKVFLEEVHEKFPQMSFRCGINLTSTYVVEVNPHALFENNEEYAALEYHFTNRFEATFRGCEIMFISDDSFIQLFQGKFWKTIFFEIGRTKNIPQTKIKPEKLPAYDYNYFTI